jgi:hypothetical protein
MAVDAWVPLFAKLIWPAVIVGVGGIYHEEAGRLIGNLNGAIESGRSVKVVDLFEIGAGTPIGDVVKASATDAGTDVDLSGVQSFDSVAEKGSSSALQQLQQKLVQSPGQTIEVLALRDNSQYSIDLLHQYIETLGIRYVVFQSDGRFTAWMDAGLFNSQLPPAGQGQWWESDKLFDHLVGVHNQSVPATASALDTLRIMEQSKVDSIAVLDGESFKSMVTREAILAKLLTATILKGGEET